MSPPEVTGLVQPFEWAHGAFQEIVNGVQPAVATDFTLKIVGDYDTRPISAFVKLVTDATAANREVVCQYLDGDGGTILTHGAGTTVPASQTAFYAFSQHFTTDIFTVDSSALCPLTPMFLEPGWSIKLHLVNAQAGDQLSAIRIGLERFETSAYTFPEGERPARGGRRRR